MFLFSFKISIQRTAQLRGIELETTTSFRENRKSRPNCMVKDISIKETRQKTGDKEKQVSPKNNLQAI